MSHAAKVRRARKKAASPADVSSSDANAATLQRLHGGSSDALRALLERRAERQRRALTTPSDGAAARPLPTRPTAPDIPAEAAATRRPVTVRFWLQFHVDFGQSLRLVGGCAELGNWVLASAASMEWGEGDMWNVTLDLPAGSVVEYKYVVMGAGGHAAAWQAGNNSVLALRHAEDEVDVYDNW